MRHIRYITPAVRKVSDAWQAIAGWFVKRWRRITRFLRPLGRYGYAWPFTMSLIVAAQATLIWAPQVGVYINALALVGLMGLAIAQTRARMMAISMAVLPVANLVTASFLPHDILVKTTLFYSVLLLLSLVYRYMFTLTRPIEESTLTARQYGFALPVMAVVGETLGAIGYLFLRHHYPYTGYSLPLVALAAVVFAFTEEMFLRGLIQQQASKIFHPLLAATGTAVLYVFLAIDHQTMLSLPVAVLLGAVLSFTYYKKPNLVLTTTINAAAKLTYVALIASFILRR